ncbi:MAG: asparagine synthase (glutamine-hydrolyzing) [Dongiaceae bacterium]
MCGIAGSWWRDSDMSVTVARRIVTQMAESLRHRGPDAAGIWIDPAVGLALGHRRLAVLDPSPAGVQPMTSDSGRYVIVYNGEIYNHFVLRRRLEAERRAPSWRGSSDTETLLACIEAWGVESTLSCIFGMFAFGLWDSSERTLLLARDPMGEKPLCYARVGRTVLFASELQALRQHPEFDQEIDRGAVALLLKDNCIPAPYTVHAHARKLLPGTFLRIRFDDETLEQPTTYWSLKAVAEAGQSAPFDIDETDATSTFEMLFGDVVRSQMISDVPLGAFLSGGIDSSAVVAMMQSMSTRPVRTYTIGFREPAFDEARHAESVARHLGTDHHTLYVTDTDALDVASNLGRTFDEPFGGVSQIPTILVSRLARSEVTVALTGDGGDELFGGYDRYVKIRIWKRQQEFVRRRAGPGRHPARSEQEVSDEWHSSAADDFFLSRVRKWPNAHAIVRGATNTVTLLDRPPEWPALTSPELRMMSVDAMTYLPDNVLVKVDRSAMSASLETRAPFLDRRIVEHAWRLPLSMKIRRGVGKHIVRSVLRRHVPPDLIDRPKQGFGVPIDDWLRGGLRSWAEDLLAERRLVADGIFEAAIVRRLWRMHLSGRRQLGNRLWPVIMFQAWRDHQ